VQEIWVDVKGYEGLYQISNLGNVKKLKRMMRTKNNKILSYEEIILKPVANSSGYFRVTLIDCCGIKKKHFIHRLVATAFCPRSPRSNVVNHKDNNPANNASCNLEWVTQSENICHAVRQNRMNFSKEWLAQQNGATRSVPVVGTNLITGEKVYYSSMAEAEKDGFNDANISACCKGSRKTHNGFRWEYQKVVI
jgi:hypothetical protein